MLNRIKYNGFLENGDKFGIVLKAYSILRDGIETSDEEIDYLISYLSNIEEYEICEKLNKIKNKK